MLVLETYPEVELGNGFVVDSFRSILFEEEGIFNIYRFHGECDDRHIGMLYMTDSYTHAEAQSAFVDDIDILLAKE